jgi:hypothetical protein
MFPNEIQNQKKGAPEKSTQADQSKKDVGPALFVAIRYLILPIRENSQRGAPTPFPIAQASWVARTIFNF